MAVNQSQLSSDSVVVQLLLVAVKHQNVEEMWERKRESWGWKCCWCSQSLWFCSFWQTAFYPTSFYASLNDRTNVLSKPPNHWNVNLEVINQLTWVNFIFLECFPFQVVVAHFTFSGPDHKGHKDTLITENNWSNIFLKSSSEVQHGFTICVCVCVCVCVCGCV